MKPFKYEIGQNFKDDNRDYSILDRYIYIHHHKEGYSEYIKKYILKCNICKADTITLRESQINRGVGCPCCNNKVVVEGINDIPTTDPWMISYFQGGYDEAKQYTHGSGKRIYPRCPECGRISKVETFIYNIYRQKSITCVCKDAISYPEKFIFNVLQQAKIEFKYQLTKNHFNWIGKYRYDFYLPKYKTIIEVHGLQHYEDKDIIANDASKKQLVIENGFNYISLNCSYSKSDFIKNSIIHSEMAKLIDVSKIDWNECNSFAKKNLCKEICEKFSEDKSVTQLANEYQLSKNSIRRMLHIGSELGICNYDGKEENIKSSFKNENNTKETSVYTVSGKYIGTYKSAKYIADNGENIVGKKLLVNSIYDCCNGRVKQYKGFIFRNKGEIHAVQII